MWYGALINVLYIFLNTFRIGTPTYEPTYVVEVNVITCSFAPMEYVMFNWSVMYSTDALEWTKTNAPIGKIGGAKAPAVFFQP
jgi:hypothetical protein